MQIAETIVSACAALEMAFGSEDVLFDYAVTHGGNSKLEKMRQ